MPIRRGPRALASAVAAAALLLAAGCTTEAEPDRRPAAPAASAGPSGPAVESYVALGDSFTAAPYVPVTDLAGGCLRSSGNYPALVAAELDATLTDVSCSGADTGDLAGRQRMGLGSGTVPPQFDALDAGTDLVTLGIGGNDRDVFYALVYRCSEVARRPGAPCTALMRRTFGQPARVLAGTGRRVQAALEDVRRLAPGARVVLVGYPRLVGPEGGCPAMPVADADVPFLLRMQEALNDALAGAAQAAGADFVDLYSMSEGHEVCSADPWVNGRVTDQRRALSFHPFAAEQEVAAREVLAAVRASTGS